MNKVVRVREIPWLSNAFELRWVVETKGLLWGWNEYDTYYVKDKAISVAESLSDGGDPDSKVIWTNE